MNLSWIYVSLIVFTLSSLCSCNEPTSSFTIGKKDADSVYVFAIPSAEDLTKFECHIENTTKKSVQFYITPAEINLFNTKTIVQSLLNDSMDEEKKCITLWEFVCNWRYHDNKASLLSKQPHEPGIMMNALESGLCDDASMVLAYLGEKEGIPSKVISLGTHTVTEFQYGQRWHLFDADRKIYYRNRNGEIADLEQLKSTPEIFDLPQVNTYRSPLAYNVIQYKNREAITNFSNSWVYSTNANEFDGYNSTMTLKEDDRLDFIIEPTPFLEKKIFTVLVENGGPYFNRTGYLTRKDMDLDTIFAEKCPYPIDRISVSSSNDLNPGQINIFYSPDSLHWYFKGIVSMGSSITFDPRIIGTNDLIFNYYLKFVFNKKNEKDALQVTNRISFSDKIFFNNSKRSFKINVLKGDFSSLNLKTTSERSR